MSVRGIGVDIVDVRRVEALLARHGGRFLERCFRPSELAPAEPGCQVGCSAARVAGRWAVKEACLKALGGGIAVIPYRDIEVLRSEGGAPVVVLHGAAAAAHAAGGGGRVLASLSHERETAVGMVIIEG
ncbi:MAG: holo-ACP synthase [bacterium]|nr:holo-ACP synthase [bacterium]